MRKNTIVLDFLRFSISSKITFGRTVLSRMSLLALFANPDVAYATGTAIIDKMEGYYMSSRGGDHQQTALMHQAEAEFNDFFRKLGYNVDRVADGDEAIILSTGFHLAKQPAPAERPEFTAEAGDVPGSNLLKRKAFPGGSSYVWQHYIGAEAPTEDKWLFAGSSTQASFLMSGLPLGEKVWFRVAAVTKDGMQPFTDPISRFIS
jgi:hypothetical protein